MRIVEGRTCNDNDNSESARRHVVSATTRKLKLKLPRWNITRPNFRRCVGYSRHRNVRNRKIPGPCFHFRDIDNRRVASRWHWRELNCSSTRKRCSYPDPATDVYLNYYDTVVPTVIGSRDELGYAAGNKAQTAHCSTCEPVVVPIACTSLLNHNRNSEMRIIEIRIVAPATNNCSAELRCARARALVNGQWISRDIPRPERSYSAGN